MIKKTSKTEPAFAGQALSESIRKKINESKSSVAEFSSRIGFSQSYTTSLLSGQRPWAGIDRDTQKKVAQFLDLPVINVLMLAEIVDPSDFVYEDSIEDDLRKAYDSLSKDKSWGMFCQRDEWDNIPINSRILIALLYEKISEIEFIKKARMIKVVR